MAHASISRPATTLPHQHAVQALSEAHLYEEEENERFLSLFSAYVTEVRLSASAANNDASVVSDDLGIPTGQPPIPPHSSDYSLSEHVAYDYLLPYLSSTAGVSPTFSLKRLSLIVQRLYLAFFPTYTALLLNLARLALWKDYRRSLRYCITFWFLWFHDLLPPALLFWIVTCLYRRRCCQSAHPTPKELQERRQETALALKFGEAVQQRLSVTTLGPIELWRLFKLHRSEVRGKAKSSDAIDVDEEDNFKRDMLQVLHELAGLHERIQNIFAWRRPAVSRRYLLLFIIVTFGALVLPAKCVVKLVYCFWGILFWHATPIVAVLPRGDRIRLVSLLFGDAPTDADYAMELIVKRAAAGQDVHLAPLGEQSLRTSECSARMDTLASTSYGNSHGVSPPDDRINWKKWGERVARGKAVLEEGRQLLSSQVSRDPTLGETAPRYQFGANNEHAFLAEYASSPGLIIVTPSTLLFTSLTRTRARLVIPHDRLRCVRKSGVLEGISITWAPPRSVDGGEREEKFRWVGNRDELFARLVGSDGGRWVTV